MKHAVAHLVVSLAVVGLSIGSIAASPHPATAAVAAAPQSARTCPATTPRPGTASRRDILNALRPQMEEMAGGDIEFVVERLNVSCNWARLVANPQTPGGQGNRYEPVDALFQRSNGVWRLRMIACGEEDCAPAAQQYRQAHPPVPSALLF